MSTNLTNNARWIVAVVEIITDPMFVTRRVLMNIGRRKYSVPEMKALRESINFDRCKLIATYSIDVRLFPYAKDWRQVEMLAKKYFTEQGILTREDKK